jgi:hypothetical protein
LCWAKAMDAESRKANRRVEVLMTKPPKQIMARILPRFREAQITFI